MDTLEPWKTSGLGVSILICICGGFVLKGLIYCGALAHESTICIGTLFLYRRALFRGEDSHQPTYAVKLLYKRDLEKCLCAEPVQQGVLYTSGGHISCGHLKEKPDVGHCEHLSDDMYLHACLYRGFMYSLCLSTLLCTCLRSHFRVYEIDISGPQCLWWPQ